MRLGPPERGIKLGQLGIIGAALATAALQASNVQAFALARDLLLLYGSSALVIFGIISLRERGRSRSGALATGFGLAIFALCIGANTLALGVTREAAASIDAVPRIGPLEERSADLEAARQQFTQIGPRFNAAVFFWASAAVASLVVGSAYPLRNHAGTHAP